MFHYVRCFSWKHFIQHRIQFRSQSSAIFGQHAYAYTLISGIVKLSFHCNGYWYTSFVSRKGSSIYKTIVNSWCLCLFVEHIYFSVSFFRMHVTKSCENSFKQSSFQTLIQEKIDTRMLKKTWKTWVGKL